MKPSERLRTVEAVIISHKDYGEADRFVTLFSREGGKIRGIGQGGPQRCVPAKRLIWNLSCIPKWFWRAERHSGSSPRRTRSQQYGIHPLNRFEKRLQAAYVMELADRFSIEEEPAPQLFRLIVIHSNASIDIREDAFKSLRYFELRCWITPVFART